MKASFRDSLFRISSRTEFEKIALDIFRFQFHDNPVYRQYVSFLGTSPGFVTSVEKIPFLPIELFKNHRIITGEADVEKVFESSGTTGSETSRHFVTDLTVYHESLISSFKCSGVIRANIFLPPFFLHISKEAIPHLYIWQIS